MNFIQKADDILKDTKNRKLLRLLPNEQYSSKEFIKDLKEGEYNRPLFWLESFHVKSSSANIEGATYPLNSNKNSYKNSHDLKGEDLMPILFQSDSFDSRFVSSKMEPWINLLKKLGEQKIIDLNAMRDDSNEPYWLSAFNEMNIPEIWLNLVKIGANPLLRWQREPKSAASAKSKKRDTKKEYTLWRAYSDFFNKIWLADKALPSVVKRSYEQQLALLPPEQFSESLFWKNGSVFSSLWNSRLKNEAWSIVPNENRGIGFATSENQGFVCVKEMVIDLLIYAPINIWPKGEIMEVQRSALNCPLPLEVLSFWYDHGLPLDHAIVDKLPFSEHKANLLEKMLYQAGGNNKNGDEHYKFNSSLGRDVKHNETGPHNKTGPHNETSPHNETPPLNLTPQDFVAKRKVKI